MRVLRIMALAFAAGVILAGCGNPMAPKACQPWIHIPVVNANGQVITTALVQWCE